jgi:GMP synthase (glutamine-hydrolysing)
MDSRPLLFLGARPEQNAADGEFAAFAAAAGVSLARHDLTRSPLPEGALDRYAGFIGGGSPFNVGDPEAGKSDTQRRVEADLATVAEAAASGATRALLTCYGIGIATRLLGGTIDRAFGEDTGTTEVTVGADAAADPVFGALPATFTAYTAHKEGSGTTPTGAVALATSDGCPVQAYRVGSLWTTQFHPELTADSFAARIAVYRDFGYFDPDDYAAVVAGVRAATVTAPTAIVQAFAAL